MGRLGHLVVTPLDHHGVGVAAHDVAQRSVEATTGPDHHDEGDATALDRTGVVHRPLDPVEAPAEAGLLVVEHGPAHLERLGQPSHALPSVPRAGGERHHAAAVRDHVDAGDDLGQHRRMAGLTSGRHRPQPDRVGTGGQRTQQRVRLRGPPDPDGYATDRPGRRADRFVGHPQGVEAGALGGRGDGSGALEGPPSGGGGRVAGPQPEFGHRTGRCRMVHAGQGTDRRPRPGAQVRHPPIPMN